MEGEREQTWHLHAGGGEEGRGRGELEEPEKRTALKREEIGEGERAKMR